MCVLALLPAGPCNIHTGSIRAVPLHKFFVCSIMQGLKTVQPRRAHPLLNANTLHVADRRPALHGQLQACASHHGKFIACTYKFCSAYFVTAQSTGLLPFFSRYSFASTKHFVSFHALPDMGDGCGPANTQCFLPSTIFPFF